MPDNRRSPRRVLVFALAVPIIALVYVTAFGGRLWSALRPFVATFLGATVIGSVYADEALKRAPATPMRAAAVLALAVALVGPGLAPAPVSAAADPAEAVIAAARQYLGHPFRLGHEGPRFFDCSGLVYRAFMDAGEGPRIGGMRLKAAGYMRWFVSRGLFTKKEEQARRGDLVIYNNGKHIGIYLGEGKVLSALVTGMAIHRLNGIKQRVSYFLRVNWGKGGGGGDDPPTDPGRPDRPDRPQKPDRPDRPQEPDRPSSGNPDNGANNPNDPETDGPAAEGADGRNNTNAVATGTMNMRVSADPGARIIGWVGRNSQFNVIGEGTSPGGYPWFEIETRGGKKGWVYSRWVRLLGS